MHKINIVPLSVNKAWKGKRYKTKEYDVYIDNMLFLLPHIDFIPENNIKLFIEFGFSSKLSDIDNPIKCLLDCLVKKYGVDDRYITELNVRKKLVAKNMEYIIFEIS